jgi:ABC-type multidrug transport system permease subunit
MRSALLIGHLDVRLFLKHRSAYVWLFVMPLAFVYFMGYANRGPGSPANRRPTVRLENQDTNFLGRLFLEELGAQGLALVAPTNPEPAARTIRIPPDFTARVLAHEPAQVQFVKSDQSAEADAAIVEARLVRALIAVNGHLLEAETGSNAPPVLTEAHLHAIMTAPNPVTLQARYAGRKPVPSGFNFSLPGNLVMYLVMNLLVFGGVTMAAERRSGVLKRLVTNPITPGALVLGKIYGLVLLGTVQIFFFLAVGRFVFGVNLGANLLVVLAFLLTFAWVAASLGVLVGSWVAAEDRVAGICVLASLLLAAFGGCWWPVEVGPPAIKTIALCLPTGWALAGLHQAISFGSGFGAVATPLVVLLAFGTVAHLLAARYFRT